MNHLENKIAEFNKNNEDFHAEVEKNGNTEKSEAMLSGLRIAAQVIAQLREGV